MYAGLLRYLRALTVSATCVALSLVTHLLGAGPSESRMSAAAILGLLMTTFLLTLAMAALSGRRWTFTRSLVTLGSSQFGLHAIFTILLAQHRGHSFVRPDGGLSMTLAHAAAALLICLGIAVNDSALNTYFCLVSSLVGSGIDALSPWRRAALISCADSVTAVRAAGRTGLFSWWQRPRILTDLVVLQCLSRRGPPAAFALAS